ncbi:MAG: hypothetical protein AB7H90_07775 [Alphaproteobacteria bacterium]
MSWKIGEIQETPAAGSITSYGFGILDNYGAPLVSFAYPSRLRAFNARTALLEALKDAVTISSPRGAPFQKHRAAAHQRRSTVLIG